jgi:hypothetical protein
MRMETLLTHELGWFEHFNRPDAALMPSLLHCVSNVVVTVCCSIFYAFVTNGSLYPFTFLEQCCRRPLWYICVSMLRHPVLGLTPPSQGVRQ